MVKYTEFDNTSIYDININISLYRIYIPELIIQIYFVIYFAPFASEKTTSWGINLNIYAIT